MKKLIPLVLTMIFVLVLSGCGKNDTYKIRITVPAGSAEEFVYSDEEISATGKKITISTGDGLGDTEVILSPVNENVETGYVATYLTPGMPVEFDAVKGEWFKIGVNMQNQTDEDIVVYVEVKNVEVRISDESTPDSVTFQGEILEIHDKYFLVKPESSWAINSADKIEVPMENMNVSPEPEVGDIIEVSYGGEILETYPARLNNIFSIKVIEEADTVSFHDKTFNKADLSAETLEWLEKYNAMSEDEQLAISYIPEDLYELCGYREAENEEVNAPTE